MKKLLQVDRLSAGYDARTIVQGVSFAVEGGSFCALLGPNGSGKTTLLRSIAGLIPVKGGRCLAGGIDITTLHERRRARQVSYIAQQHSKMIGVDVLSAVLMGRNPYLSYFAAPSAADRQDALDCLHQMDIAHLAERDFSSLSQGQKQLVILSRTLMQNAPIMLMDEPDSALDFVNRNLVLNKVRGLIHAGGKAGLIALHDPNFALRYCDRLLIMKEGALQADLRLSEASAGDIGQALSSIYGRVELLAHRGHYLMVQEDADADD